MSLIDLSRFEGCLFDGTWTPAVERQPVPEPATGHTLFNVGSATPQEVATAAATARAAQPAWAKKPHKERAAIFRKAADLLDAHADAITPTLMRESGSIAPKIDVELQMAAGICREAAAMCSQPAGLMLPADDGRISLARRVPHGVVGVISPFNFPLILSIRAVAPALAAGNAVVLKPDLRTPILGGFLIARIFEEAGLPAGCLHVLPGGAGAGQAMCIDRNIAMISFTGSTAVGSRVGELAGKHLKKVTLELGGKNSLVVLDDADVAVAASNAAWGCYLHQGQICMTTGLVFVHEKVYEPFLQALIAKAKHLPVGDPASGQVALGPIIDQRQVARIDGIVRDTVAAGAVLEAGGTHDGPFFQPTVLTGVKPGMRSFEEEVFGPVASVVRFHDEDELVALATRTEYGLTLGVITANVARGLALAERIPTGIVHINDQTVGDDPSVPFGGRGASGNGGRHGGPANWEEFAQWQWVTIDASAHAYPF
ncbi:benzaldehyde dehydrogenase (NAD) [Variovorax boronicumulans]|uniref:4-(hydroxymethyl)benzenesulfonate dehydrogenase n=1 Tax=Variovorax boronicumulans TaxID=436515 RepID=A0AAW8DT14_9BURK|nr:benzaldehyde dehydrogenase [Variovorax boronicumulans]MDP9877423.1 benzaldehyde dehydrogenase (NAD) [Variovorax boronicumulans]MDP9922708.1 benzaldehyde dehydrogenase (NAD) [Variovorax boronicumulans]